MLFLRLLWSALCRTCFVAFGDVFHDPLGHAKLTSAAVGETLRDLPQSWTKWFPLLFGDRLALNAMITDIDEGNIYGKTCGNYLDNVFDGIAERQRTIFRGIPPHLIVHNMIALRCSQWKDAIPDSQTKHFMCEDETMPSSLAYARSIKYIFDCSSSAYLALRELQALQKDSWVSRQPIPFTAASMRGTVFVEQLGDALHCLQDSYSPTHTWRKNPADGTINHIYPWSKENKEPTPGAYATQPMPHSMGDLLKDPLTGKIKEEVRYAVAASAMLITVLLVMLAHDRTIHEFRQKLQSEVLDQYVRLLPLHGAPGTIRKDTMIRKAH